MRAASAPSCEGGGDEGGDDTAAALAGVGENVAHEVDAATAKDSWPMSSKFWCLRSSRAISTSSITSAVTRENPPGARFGWPAQSCFLQPYSPDLNPIEQVFAKLKTLLRKAAERAVEATWKRIGALLNAFTPNECANYFVNAGYASM